MNNYDFTLGGKLWTRSLAQLNSFLDTFAGVKFDDPMQAIEAGHAVIADLEREGKSYYYFKNYGKLTPYKYRGPARTSSTLVAFPCVFEDFWDNDEITQVWVSFYNDNERKSLIHEPHFYNETPPAGWKTHHTYANAIVRALYCVAYDAELRGESKTLILDYGDHCRSTPGADANAWSILLGVVPCADDHDKMLKAYFDKYTVAIQSMGVKIVVTGLLP